MIKFPSFISHNFSMCLCVYFNTKLLSKSLFFSPNKSHRFFLNQNAPKKEKRILHTHTHWRKKNHFESEVSFFFKFDSYVAVPLLLMVCFLLLFSLACLLAFTIAALLSSFSHTYANIQTTLNCVYVFVCVCQRVRVFLVYVFCSHLILYIFQPLNTLWMQ